MEIEHNLFSEICSTRYHCSMQHSAATALLLFALASGQPPMPTPDQVAWLDREVGALFQFNIGEYGTVSVCLCIIRPNPHYM